MRKHIAVALSLVAGQLSFLTTPARAVKINVRTGITAIPVTLQTEGASVAGTQNDITYTGATIASSKTCLRTYTIPCATDADCPKANPLDAGSRNEPCIVRPNCTVNAAGKEGFFSFLKTAGCTGAACNCSPGSDCTAIRAIIVSLNLQKPTAIADGTTLYTCTFGVPAIPVPLINTSLAAGDPSGSSLAPVTGSNGELAGDGCSSGIISCTAPHCMYCVGDCDDNTEVFGNEVTKAVNIVAGNADLTTCVNADANCDGDVFGNEVTIGVNNVANGCANSQ